MKKSEDDSSLSDDENKIMSIDKTKTSKNNGLIRKVSKSLSPENKNNKNKYNKINIDKKNKNIKGKNNNIKELKNKNGNNNDKNEIKKENQKIII